MTARERSFFPQGVNMYVPRMQYAHDVVHKGVLEVYLGSPLGLDADGIHTGYNGQAVAGTQVFNTSFVPAAGGLGFETDAPYGQTITITPSADPGAGGLIVDVAGEDYLGQPMKARLTAPNGASALVESTKAFKRVLSFTMFDAATNVVTAVFGWGNKLGLPYRVGQVIGAREVATELTDAAAIANTTSPDLTDPATLTTNDPRGLYDPTAAPTGSLDYWFRYIPDGRLNANNNGGLHGIRHFV